MVKETPWFMKVKLFLKSINHPACVCKGFSFSTGTLSIPQHFEFCPKIEKMHQQGGSKGWDCILDPLRRPNWRAIIPESHSLCCWGKNILNQGTINNILKAGAGDRQSWSKSWAHVDSCESFFSSPCSDGERLFEAISFWFILGKDKQTQSTALNSHSKPVSTHTHTHIHSLCAFAAAVHNDSHFIHTQLSTSC